MPKKPDKTEETFRLVGEGMKKMSDRIDIVESAESRDESLVELFREFLELQKSRILSEIKFDPVVQAEPLKVLNALRCALRRQDLARIDLDPRAKLKAAAKA